MNRTWTSGLRRSIDPIKAFAAPALRPVKNILLGLWTTSCLTVSAPTPDVPIKLLVKPFDVKYIKSYLL